MAKMVGLSRNIKLPWLNKVVEFVVAGKTESEIKDALNEYLSFEIESPTNLRKTREILMNIWVYENEYSERLRPEALKLIQRDSENQLSAHWIMMLAAYPVFQDLCKLISKMSEFQDEVTLAQIKQKLFDEWGERTTLYHSIDKLIATLKALEVLTCGKPGKYRINRHTLSNEDIITYITYAMMVIDDGGYYSLQQLQDAGILFPFEYQIKKEWILGDERFTLANFGGEVSFALN
ncbi:MAG: hypothetical protein O0V67_07895 [Methanocorpusculum sp.]|nr:hypothetical protein [Methanocorpusculum sp.]